MKIPKHWQYISFTEILDIIGGSQPAKEEFIANFQEGYIRLLQIRDFGDKPVPTFVRLTNKLRFCDKDDILIARYGVSIGRILTGMSGTYNVAIVKVIIPKPLNKKFIFYFLKSNDFQQYITANERAAINGFNKEDLNNFQIPIAPLIEQTEIVSILDEIFEKFETAKKSLAKIPRLLARYRQSVLEKAISGELTEDWREENNVEFEWENKKLGAITSLITSGSRDWAKFYSNKGALFIRIGNLQKNSIKIDLSPNNLKFVNPDSEEGKRTLLKQNDILISITGDLGIIGLVQQDIGEAYINQHIALVRVKPNDFNTTYIAYYLLTDYVKIQINSLKSGNVKAGLTLKDVFNISINLPSLPEQTEIVNRVEKLLKKADEAEAKYNQAMQMIDKLQASVLAKAFSGELSEPQPNDESVAVLLEKIKTEKARLEQERKELQKAQTTIKKTMAQQEKVVKSVLDFLRESPTKSMTVEEAWQVSEYRKNKEVELFLDVLVLLEKEGKIKREFADEATKIVTKITLIENAN